jgi:hypothetical protein
VLWQIGGIDSHTMAKSYLFDIMSTGTNIEFPSRRLEKGGRVIVAH